MTASLNSRLPNLGKLSLAIIENIVKPVLGSDAIQIIKAPFSHRNFFEEVCKILALSEKRFKSFYSEEKRSLDFISIDLSNIDKFQKSFWEFVQNPAKPDFRNLLEAQFHDSFPEIDDPTRVEIVSRYIEILKEEMIGLDNEVRQKISTAALLEIKNNIVAISSTLSSIDQNTKAIADAILKNKAENSASSKEVFDFSLKRLDKIEGFANLSEKARSSLKKYVEKLQTSILDVFRQDQHILLSVDALSKEDPDTLFALQQTLRSAYSIQVESFEEEAQSQTIEECVHNSPFVVLLGDPGAGKTTSLRYLALRQIENFLNGENNLLPAWVSLSHWQNKEMSAKDFLWQEFIEFFTETNALSREEFESLLFNGNLIVFLDGLNELPHREQESQDLPVNIRDKKTSENKIIDPRESSILSLSKEINSQFVLSCRISEYIHLPGWREYRILPLSDQQVYELVKKHLGSKNSILEEILEKQPDLRNLVRNAFFLRSLIRLVQEGWEKIPSNRFELVQFTCRAALNREAIKQGKNPDEITNLIGKFSFEAMDDGLIGSTIEIPLKNIVSSDNNSAVVSGENQPLSTFIFAEAAGLVMNVKDDSDRVVYRYLHQLVQEALALIYLKNDASHETEHPEVLSLIQIGRIHQYWGKTKEAQENFSEALSLCPSIGMDKYRAVILLNLSRIYRLWRLSRKSIEFAELALQVLDDSIETPLLASAHRELGNVYEQLWRDEEAEAQYLRAAQIYEKLDNKSDYAYEIIYGIGDFYSNPRIYKFRKSMDWYKKALSIFQELGDKHGVGVTHYYMGSLSRLLGDTDNSEKYFKISIEEFEQLDDKRMIMSATSYLGYLYRDMRQYSKAQPYFEIAYQTALEFGEIYEQLNLLVIGFAWINSYQNKYNLAIDYLDKALKLAQRISEPDAFEIVYGAGFGFVCWRGKKYEDAHMYLQEHKKYITDETSISFIELLLIKWSDIFGESIGSSPTKRFITDIFFHIQTLYVRLNNPATRFGKLMWAFTWRFMYFRKWSTMISSKKSKSN